MNKKTILYLGNFSFPLGNAAGKRVYANGKLLSDIGYQVVFIGTREYEESKNLLLTKKNYDNFIYYEFKYPASSIEWLQYRDTFNQLQSLLSSTGLESNLAAIIYYGSPRISLFNKLLIKYCKSRNIKVISDCVDWLTVNTRNPIFNIIKWADTTYQKKYVNKQADGVIAISSYLSNYYVKSGKRTLILPPLSPEENYSLKNERSRLDSKKIISYAGNPFRKNQQVKDVKKLKDRLDKAITLLSKVKDEGVCFQFNIYGHTKDDFLKALPSHSIYLKNLGDSIVFHGYKNNSEVVKNICDSDFTILIRDVNRDSSAGFPTKVSESISCGTPVITTRTSDLDSYICDGENGFFLEAVNDEKNVLKLCEILRLDSRIIENMKEDCKENNYFFYKRYQEITEEFFIEIMRNDK
ncbi:glycosyltransferase [Paenibacillus sp. LHD-117]|uniref:glycosyltransferase n=1 Tax=Paenibacillus sp. LHD-117 TaxID=3071412 RepID=UPI0027E1CCFD|nr:glycosyltransferase [Paenibacillus sp. LHD-117]MDQ6420680.1 glycosyltransferase [Paenibacillus sp. LHD-117]